MDKERLTKLMMMTTSDNDHEALAALRMANALISKEKVTWGEVLAAGGSTMTITLHRHAPQPHSYQTDESWVAPHLRDKVTIELMFRGVFAQPRSSHEVWQFLDSIHAKWQKHGVLTQGQYQALRRCYQRATRTA